MYPLKTYRIGLLVAHTFLWVVEGENKNFFRKVLFFLSKISTPAGHPKNFFFAKDVAIKKKYPSNQVRFFDIRCFFRYKFTIKSGSGGTLSFFSCSKIWIFPCFFDIFSKISPEILGEKVWYFDEYILSRCPLNPYRFGLLVAHTFRWGE